MNMRIRGTLTTLSPMTIGEPGDNRLLLNGKRAKVKGQGFPWTRVTRLPVPGIGKDGASLMVPIVKPNTLRGLLRRAGASLIEEALIARGQKISLPTYSALRSGSPFGNPDKVDPSVDEIQTAMETPPLSVFGGGPRMVRGAVRVYGGMPICQDLVEVGIVSPGYDRILPSGSFLTANLWRKRTDDAGSFADPTGAGRVMKDYNAAIDAWQLLAGSANGIAEAEDTTEEQGEDQPKKSGGEKQSKVRGLASLTAFEVVPPGVPFTFEATVESEHSASLGYFLLALERFANNQCLGGNYRLGFGKFALDVTVDHGGFSGPLFVNTDGHYTLVGDDAIANLMAAARAWLDAVDAASLDAMMRPSDKSLDELRGKLKSAPQEIREAFDEVML